MEHLRIMALQMCGVKISYYWSQADTGLELTLDIHGPMAMKD